MTQVPIQIKRYIGSSSDTKPTGATVPLGSTFYEYNTGIMYITYDGTNWVPKEALATMFGKPTLEAGGVGKATWTKALSVGTQRVAWAAQLDAGAQSAWNDYAKVIVPVNELPFTALRSVRLESFYTAGFEVGTDMAVCVYMHDPTDFDQHIELSHTPLTNAGAGYRELNYPTDIPGSSWGWYGNVTDTPDTCPSDWDTSSYTWAQFQADSVFKTWTIYRISFDYGYQTGDIDLDGGYLCQAQINGITIPLEPSIGKRVPVITPTTGGATTATAIATLAPGAAFKLLGVRIHFNGVLDATETLTITKNSTVDAYDTLLFSLDIGTPDIVDVKIPFGGEDDFYSATDTIVIALSANAQSRVWGCDTIHELV